MQNPTGHNGRNTQGPLAGLTRAAALAISTVALIAAAVTFAPTGARAQVVPPPPDPSACYGIADESGGDRDQPADGLSKIDRFTGVPTDLGLTGTNSIEAMSFAPGTLINGAYTYQVLYAIDDPNTAAGAAGDNYIGWVNLETGVWTSIAGPIPIAEDVDGMTYDAQSGLFWMTDRIDGAPDTAFAYDMATNSIVSGPFSTGIADPTSPDPDAAQFVTAAGSPYSDFDDIAIRHSDGRLYAILNEGGNGGGLVELSKVDGSIIDYIGLFDTVTDFDGNGIVDDMEGLAFFNDGTLYGTTGANGPTNPADPTSNDLNRFWTIDPVTGNTVLIGSFGGLDYRDYEALGCFVADATVVVEKATEGVDADTPTGPTVTTADVTWTYVIENTSTVSLVSGIVLVDDVEGQIFNQNTSFSRCAEGDLGLTPGATLAPRVPLTCTVTGITQPGQYSNTATLSASFDPGNGLPLVDLSDEDPSHYVAGVSQIDVVKTVVVGDNVDCTAITPEPGDDLENVAVGDTVTYCIHVTNTGTAPASDVRVVDDQFTANPADDIIVHGPVDLEAGELSVGEFTYVVEDQQPRTNTVRASGVDTISGQPTNEASDPASILPPQGNAAIAIVKTVVVGDNIDCTIVTPEPGDDEEPVSVGDIVTYCITVTNTGTGPAADVTIIDDNFTPADATDDVTLLTGATLLASESRTVTFTHTVADQTPLENIATATATDTNAAGAALEPVSDPSSILPPQGNAAIAIVKTVVVGDNVDCTIVTPEPGDDEEPVSVGDIVTYCITVTNTGTGPAADVTIVDDNFTPADATDDVTLLTGATLLASESRTVTFTHTVADQTPRENIATATATDTNAAGAALEPVSDPSSILPPQGNAAIAIVKTVVAGANAACGLVTPLVGDDTLTGLAIGDQVTFCITVTNTGTGPAADVTLIDNNFTRADASDDVTLIDAITLAPDESANAQFNYTVTNLDQLENTATATATDTNSGGDPLGPVSDPSSIAPEGSAVLDVIKTVVVGDNVDCDAVAPERGDDEEAVVVGDIVTYCVIVQNIGDAPAVDVTVIDDNFTPGDAADDFTVIASTSLAAGATATGFFRYQVTDQTPLENTVTATGTDLYNDVPINESRDPASILAPQGNAQLSVVKTAVAGENVACDAITPLAGDDEIVVELGDVVTFCVTVTNIGGGPASNVQVVDNNFTPQTPADDFTVIGPVDLASGESATGSFTHTIVTLDPLENTVTATGTDVNAQQPTNQPTDPSSVLPEGMPILDVVKTVMVGDNIDCDTVTPERGDDEELVGVGDVVTYCVTVTNTGNAPATDIVVTDDNFTPDNPGDDFIALSPAELGIGQSITGSFTYAVTDQTPLENTVTATGVDPYTGNPTNEPSDPASILPPQGNAELVVVKTVVDGADPACDFVIPRLGDDTLAVEIGDSVTYCIVVKNIGDQPALDVTVTDDNFTPGDESDDVVVIGPVDLDPDQEAVGSFSFEVTELGALENIVIATGTDSSTLDPTNEPTDPASIVPFGSPILDVTKTAVFGPEDSVDCSAVVPEPGLDEIVVDIGDMVTFCISVVNNGDGPAIDVVVTDDNFTPDDDSDDVVVIDVPVLDPNGGTATGSITLEVTDVDGGTNIVTATGTDPVTGDPTNEPKDPAAVLTPSAELTKQVLRGADADCSTAVEGVNEVVIGEPGDPITWCLTVTNTGSTHLVVTEVQDSVLAITVPVPAGSQLLAPGESVTVSAPGAVSDDGLDNLATIAAQPVDPDRNPLPDPETGDPVPPLTPTDTATEGPAKIELTKQVLRGADRDCTIAEEGVHEQVVGSVGDAVTWCFTVTNTGVSPVADVIFNDVLLEISDRDLLAENRLTVLAPGRSISFSENGSIPDGGADNTATVSAVPSMPDGSTDDPSVAGSPVLTDDNDAEVDEASIEVEKMVLLGSGADCSNAMNGQDESVSANPGDPITWCFRVTNTGSVPLEVTEVSDDTLGLTVSVPAELQIIFAGESFEVGAAGTVADEDIDNVATVEGTPLDPELNPIVDPETGRQVPPPEDEDTASSAPTVANLTLAKSNGLADDATRVHGSTLPYEVIVTNEGPDAAQDVVMVDKLPTGLVVLTGPQVDGWDCSVNDDRDEITCETDSLAADEQVTFAYEVRVELDAPLESPLVNVAEVTSTTYDDNPDDNKDEDRITVPTGNLIQPVPTPTPVPDEVLGEVEVPLAHTGSNTITLVAIGNLALLLGSAFVIIGRHRKNREEQVEAVEDQAR